MLVQLKQSGALGQVAGVVFGGMRSPPRLNPSSG